MDGLATTFIIAGSSVLTALVVSLVSPLMLARQMAETQRRLKKEDWDRQDAVAAQAREAATLLLEENRKVAATALETSQRVEASAEETALRLKKIHTLVDGGLTKEMKERLAVMITQRVLLKRLPGATDDDRTAIVTLESEIADLETTLAERLKQTRLIEAEQAVAQAQATQRT
jgi:hypothetical protein